VWEGQVITYYKPIVNQETSGLRRRSPSLTSPPLQSWDCKARQLLGSDTGGICGAGVIIGCGVYPLCVRDGQLHFTPTQGKSRSPNLHDQHSPSNSSQPLTTLPHMHWNISRFVSFDTLPLFTKPTAFACTSVTGPRILCGRNENDVGDAFQSADTEREQIDLFASQTNPLTRH
jgi:hypothetical protein